MTMTTPNSPTTPSEHSRLTDGYDPIGMTPYEIRLAMLANGYTPIPLDGKKPMLNNWQNTVASKDVVGRWGNVGPNTGMLTATAPVLDIDILDERAAQIVDASIWKTRARFLSASACRRSAPFCCAPTSPSRRSFAS
jgi:hypothetical protein